MSPLIYEFLENTAAGYPDFDAIRWLEKKEIRSIKYRALVDDISLIRRGLLAEDFSDEHIVVIGGSSKEWVETYLGIVTGPNTAIPLDTAMPEDELFELINRSDASGIFLDKMHSEWVSVDPASGNIRLLDVCPAIRKIWMMDGTECGEGVESLSELMEKGLKVEGGDKLGKTIIFARRHNHAKFIEEQFNMLYP
ncbi:MAG: AMP-binding protein, partial [Eubacterium sp.]|nr:AMP-binding protein [Eubacterium sp.]